ncbi:MAG: uroporphyrinogen-III C-methyltransferase [Acidobacteria bacterium]|nr:MAG: uroporphyrinogen-III C-methyltransferase [Acidobacteriota bacterium]
MNGKVFIVGAGPGDPRLMTVRGLQCIQAADVLIYDRLVDRSLLDEAPPHAERVYAGKESSHHALPQEEINALMETHARMGRTIVRLKGGDPFVFGRGGEEAAFLAERGIAFEIVPGVSSATAVPAFAGIPLTQRGISSSFAVVTGHGCGLEQLPNFAAILRHVGTLVILMGVLNLTRTSQRTFVSTLGELSAHIPELQPPAVIVVGQVVLLRETLRWFQELQPLSTSEQ